jgi:hypothetical protein
MMLNRLMGILVRGLIIMMMLHHVRRSRGYGGLLVVWGLLCMLLLWRGRW